jgi:hypothetical protein
MEQKTSKASQWWVIGVTAVFVVWWLYITLFLRNTDHNSVNNQLFGATYGVVSLIGGVIGLRASKKWGGSKSLIGKALLFFAFGLLAQEFGQLAYSFYTYVLKVDIPYPSWGDLGYFSSVLFYIYAAWLFARVTGLKFSLKDTGKKIFATVLPLLLLGGSYMFFLRDYQFSWSHPLTIFLDFGYPLGQAVYLTVALITYLLSNKVLGGVMRRKVLAILFALFVQYIADFTFLNSAKSQTAFPGGANDLMYLLAYLAMALALCMYLNVSTSSNKAVE